MRRAVLAALALGACSPSPGPATNHGAISSEPSAMIDLLAELADFLHRPDLTVDEVVARVGPIAEDPGIPQPAQLTPSLSGVSAAALARYPDGVPYELTLVPAETARPTLGALAARFGAYTPLRTDRGRPRKVELATVGPPWRIALIVELPLGTEIADTAPAAKLNLLRERPDATTP